MAARKGNTVQVLYTSFDRKFTEREWEKHFCRLPKEIQTKIMRYHRWQDRQATVLGYLLLQEGLRGCGYTLKSLKDVSVDRFGRPYVNHGVDFNISHTDGCVVCALTCQGRLGIDVEKIKPIDLSDFRDFMSSVQWEKIKKSENKYETFYDFWTIKESALKADGRGLSVPLEQVEIHGDKALLDGRTWYVKKLNIGPVYSCHLAYALKDTELEMNEIDFKGYTERFSQKNATLLNTKDTAQTYTKPELHYP